MPRGGRRAFLAEIAIVVIGVLIALAAEQAVQWLNWQNEVQESRAAMKSEIAYNLRSRQLRHNQVACVDRRLDELQRWHDSWIAGHPLTPVAPIGRISARPVNFDAWNITQTGQVAAHIPLEERVRYAYLYSFFRIFANSQQEEMSYWPALQKYDRARTMNARDLMELQGLINNLQQMNLTRKTNWIVFENLSKEFNSPLGVHRDTDTDLCRTMFKAPASDGKAMPS